jgi:hypothetical protein
MKTKQLSVLLVAVALVAALQCVAQTPQPFEVRRAEAVFEELPVLNARDILRPEFLTGPHHKVREEVPTYSGANRFTIDSDFGVFEGDGNEMLLKRINEINAIAQLKEVSRTDEFKDALGKAAKSPLAAAKNIVNDPVNTIANVPKGIMKFMSRAGESVKNIGNKTESSAADGGKMQQLIGFSDAKRKLAIELGVDPYSTNTALQHELDGIAWASFAGGATFSLATLPLGGGAGTALTLTEVSGDLNDILREKSPTDLKILNRKSLLAMGATERATERFLNNNAFSPSEQTAFVLNLKSLNGVTNRGAFVRAAGETSSDESDAIFCVQTTALMSKIHKDKPLARLAMIGDFPICIAKDGTVIVALQWDYAAWTSGAAGFTSEVQKLATESGKKNVLVVLSGQVSPRLREELEKRGFTVQDRLVAGPLK